MKNTDALLVVDVQRDFIGPNAPLGVPNGYDVIPVINSIWPKFQNRILTRDYHPAGHKSFASAHTDENGNARDPFDQTIWISSVTGKEINQTLWPDHCVQGTPGAEFHPLLETDGARLIISKGMDMNLDSYSAFIENDGVTGTGLAEYLRAIGVTTVYVTGLASDYCSGSSARDANELGFTTWFVEDANRAISDEAFATIKSELLGKGVNFITSDQLT